MTQTQGLKGTLSRFLAIDGKNALVTDAEMTVYVLDHCEIFFSPDSYFFCKTELIKDRYYPYFEVMLPRFQKEFAAVENETYRQATEAKAFRMGIDFGHTCPNWQEIITAGFVGLKKRAEEYAGRYRENPEKGRFYNAVLKIYEASERFILRVIQKADAENRSEIARGLKNLLVSPPQSMFEAIQLLLLYHCLQHFAEETWIRTFGRVDQLLYPFFRKTEKQEAAKLVSAFINEIRDHGMSENQPFAIGGSDPSGHSTVNELSYLFIEEYKKLKPPYVKIHVLCAPDTPEDFLKSALDGIRQGANSICFLADATLKRSLLRLGIAPEDTLDYHVDGCYECGGFGELTSPATSKLSIPKAVELALNGGVDVQTGYRIGLPVSQEAETFEDFYREFLRQLGHICDLTKEWVGKMEALYPRIHAGPLFSSTYPLCMETGKDIFADFGAKYNNTSITGIGLGTAVDSLMAVKKLVFDDRRMTLAELNDLMKNNWVGQEALRITAKNKFPKYGMADASVDRYAADIVDFLGRQINGAPNAKGGTYRLGLYSITWRWEMGQGLAATPDGRLAGETTSLNSGASFGADREGITAHILSATAVDATNTPTAMVLDIDLHSSAVKGENGLQALYATLKTYLDRGGFAIHYNVLNADVLRAAQKNPEEYPNLQVRVCGWNMLFNRLPKNQQDEYICRSER